MIANQQPMQKFFLYSSTCTRLPLLSLIAAFTLSACTVTGSDTSSLQLSSTASNSLVAEALQTAADEKIAEDNTAKPLAVAETKPTPVKPPVKSEEPAKKAETIAVAAAEPTAETATAEPAAKPTLVAALFSAPKTPEAFAAVKPEAAPAAETAKPAKTTAPQATEQAAKAPPPAQAEESKKSEKPVVLASTLSKPALELKKKTSTQNYNYSLPGVRAYGGLEIKHRNAVYDDSDIDANEEDDAPHLLRVSAPGLARLAPNGLRVQRESVDVACLKPKLVKILRKLESHFRKPVIVTSGYRSPSYNVKVRGARRSLHMTCAAADIQIEGISKWEIARVARAMPSRGGVGTYCHTKSVHIDIGPERDWNWKCRAKG